MNFEKPSLQTIPTPIHWTSRVVSLARQPQFPGILLAILGIVLQLRQFAVNRSLWLDEAYLADNLPTHSLRYLLTQPLDSNQTAPAGFLVGLKILAKLFHYQDLYLRLLPLVFGCALILIAYRLKDRFQHPWARILFVGMLSFCPVLIYYSTEIKPYILDACLTLLIVLVALNYRRWKFGCAILAGVGGLAILFSTPVVFALAAVGVVTMIQALRQHDWPASMKLSGVGLAWLIVFGLNYAITLHNVVDSLPLAKMWGNAFAPLPTSIANLQWYLESLLILAAIGFARPEPLWIVDQQAWYAPQTWVILACILIGAFFLYRRDRVWFWMNSLIIAFTLLGSFSGVYPFRSRPILFLIPIVFIYLCAGVDGMLTVPRHALKIGGACAAVFIFALGFIPGVQLFLHPTNLEDIKGALAFLQSHQARGDQIAISDWSYAAFIYYSRFYQVGELKQVRVIPPSYDGSAYLEDLCADQPSGRIWFLFSHRFNEAPGFLDVFSSRAQPIMKWEGSGAGVYLFDFSSTNLCK